MEHQCRSLSQLRPFGRARAIEHEPDLSVGIREAPGESDKSFTHRVGPEGFSAFWALLIGRLFAWVLARNLGVA